MSLSVWMKEGADAALTGKSRDDCPYKESQSGRLHWHSGYSYVRPNEKSTVEEALSIFFGGPKTVGAGEPWLEHYSKENFYKDYGNCRRNKVFEEHIVKHGVYDISGLAYCIIPDRVSFITAKLTPSSWVFVQKYGPTTYIVSTNNDVVLLSGKPIGASVIGSKNGCILMPSCPKSLLIIPDSKTNYYCC